MGGGQCPEAIRLHVGTEEEVLIPSQGQETTANQFSTQELIHLFVAGSEKGDTALILNHVNITGMSSCPYLPRRPKLQCPFHKLVFLTVWGHRHTFLGQQMEEFDSSALGRVTVYSIQGCPHCVQAKAILGRLGVPVCDVDVGRHPELRARVKELTGRSSVPQIFFNNIHVGGNDDLQKLAPEELQRLVNVVKKEPLPADAPPLPDENPPEDTTGETDGEFMCERDELADVIKDLKHGTVIGSHWRGLTLYKKSFSGDQLVDWLQKEKGMASAEACNTGQALLQKKYMVSVRGCGQQDGSFGKGKDALYRLLEDDPHSALNAGQTAACSPIQAAELSLLVRELVLKLFSEHLSADGKSVDYKGMSVNPAFERYCELAIQLQRVELLSLSREEKLAFFINIYNALVIHGYLRLGAPTNMWQRYRFFNYVSSPNWKEKFNYGMKWCSGGTERFAQLLRPFPKRPRYKGPFPMLSPSFILP
ncbi:hypothetical protein FQN60_001476 [Etheostoma spectabile]|uniref:DEP domain-containing protein n=1 Tax=Etheostoma spectabile TaxID=54343 RepID=A0A5J5D0S4_9PERO|nr:hypothetical protein FQN60_001476 [Etheostoma spectabile]